MLKTLIIIIILGVVLWYLALPALVILSLLPQFETPPINYFAPTPSVSTQGLEDDRILIDIYEPSRAARSNLVLMHAANEQGKDDPRLKAIAENFARAGLRVIAPTLPSMNRQVFHPDVIGEMEKVIEFTLAEYGDQPAKLMSFSIGVGPELIVAGRFEELDLIIAFGGYLDLESVVAFHTTGKTADPFGLWLLARYYAQFLPPEDAEIFFQIADRKWQNLEADISDIRGDLGPKGQAALKLILNKDPEKVEELIEGLPRELKNFFSVFDPEPGFEKIPVPVLLLHSKRDIVIPFEESKKLLSALRQRDKKADLIILEVFDHVNPAFPELTAQNLVELYLPEFFKLYRAAFKIIY